MTENDKSIDARVKAWLESQGYPLEMEVARVFQTAGFNVLQSDYYSDPETNTAREIDVVAIAQGFVETLLIRVSFVVECKSSRDKPWILFTSSHLKLSDTARLAQRATSDRGFGLLWSVRERSEVLTTPLFQLGERPAYGMTQAFTTGNDVTFAAATSVAKCTRARVEEMNRRPPDVRPIAEIVLPVIVIEGRLFEYYLTESSERVLSEIQRGILLWRNPVIDMPHTIMHVLTLPALPGFIAEAREAAKLLIKGCLAEARVLWQEWKDATAAESSSK